MSKGMWRRDAAAILLCAALIALVFATGVLNKIQTWGTMEYYNLRFSQGTAQIRIEDGASYGIQNSGPGFSLRSGTYRLKYWVDTDGSGEILFQTGNGASITPEVIEIGPNQPTETITLEVVDDADDLQILIDFQSGTYMNVNEIRLYTPEFTDDAFTFAFLLCAACALWLLWHHGWLTPERRGRLIFIGIAVLVVSAPVLKDNLCIYHDTNFHMARIMNLADGLKSGQFPVRAGGFTFNGYGAITSVFYPDLFLYPFAMMVNAGASIEYVMSALCIAASMLAAATMYACAKRIYRDEWTATLAAVLYVCAAYRLNNLFVRCAVGEFLAMGFFPLFVLGLWEVFFGDKERWATLVLGAFAVFMSHIITTLLCATLAVGLGVICLPRVIREKRMGAIVKAILSTALLSLFFLVPLATYSAQGVSAEGINVFKLSNSAIAPAQLFLQGAGDLPLDPSDLSLSGFPVELGLTLVIGAMLALYARLTAKGKPDVSMRYAMMFLLCGAVFALMATTLFPWSYVSLVTDLYDRIQFAWRMIGPACGLLALAGAYGYRRISEGHELVIATAVLTIALLFVMPTLSDQTRKEDYITFGENARTSITYGEYNLPGTNIADIRDREAHADGEVTLTDYSKDGTRMTMHVKAEKGGSISLPVFGFDGYAAEVDGVRMQTGLGENNRLTVEVPAGTSGTLRVWFAGKAIWRAADCVSLATAVLLAVRGVRRRRKARHGRETVCIQKNEA